MTTLSANGLSYKSGDGSVNHKYTPPSEPNAEKMTSNLNDDIQSSSNFNSNYAPITNQSLNHNKLNDDSQNIIDSLQLIKDLDLFLVTAPVNWHENQVIRRYFLNKEEGFVSCVYWNNLYFITGTDIVRCIAYKMYHIGREIVDRKKFEEGIFSDLRALKTGTHSILETSRSPFLKFLHRNQCLRTQKKQKVFFWFSVPHNKLFADVLERDLKRELSNQPATTKPVTEVFKAFEYDQSLPLLEQLSAHFSDYLGQDVSPLILKTNNMISASDNPTSNFTTNANKNETEHTDAKFNTNQPSTIQHLSQNSNNLNSGNNINDAQSGDDFPLDFLDPSTSLMNENYITSIDSSGGLKSATKYYPAQINFNDESMISPKHKSDFQLFQQFQNQPQSAGYSEQIDNFLLNALNPPLLSATYQQPQNQPMYIFSGLPSTIDPLNTMSNINQQHNMNSPVPPANMSHILPLSMHQPLSTYVINNENNTMDQALVNNNLSSQHPQLLSQIVRSQSPPISAGNTVSFLNLQSAGLIPISMPLPSSTVKIINTDETLSPTKKIINDSRSNIDPNHENILMENFCTDNNSNMKNAETNDTTTNMSTTTSNTYNNPNDKLDADIKVKLEENADGLTFAQSATTQQRTDYMMLAIQSLSNNGHVNFGIVGNQLFTPGTINAEYNTENPALSAGVGISPVIGFNNGLLSAIQYQPQRHSTFAKKSDFPADDGSIDIDINKSSDGSEKNVEKIGKRLKGILQNNNGNKSNVSKPRNLSKNTNKRRLLNPTLQHLELDSLFDDSDLSSDENDDDKTSVPQ